VTSPSFRHLKTSSK